MLPRRPGSGRRLRFPAAGSSGGGRRRDWLLPGLAQQRISGQGSFAKMFNFELVFLNLFCKELHLFELLRM